MPLIQTHEWTVHYDEFGAPDRPPLVLVHGLMSDASTVSGTAEALSGRFRVVAPDALGHGRSSRPESFTLEDQGRMIAGLIAGLGYSSAALMGISMGSYIAALAAILAPAAVSHLVLVVGKAHGTTSSVAAYAARKGHDLSAMDPESAMALMAGALWSSHTSQARRDEILARTVAREPLSADQQAIVERSLAGFDLRPRLGAVTARTLVISGADDGLNPPEAGRELADHIRGSRFEVYERSGHLLAWEEPERLVADVTEFLAS